MNARETYEVYTKMFAAIPDLEQRIKETLLSKGYTNIYCVYLSVGDEAERKYFADIEYSKGTSESYNRIYGLYDEDAINKFIGR